MNSLGVFQHGEVEGLFLRCTKAGFYRRVPLIHIFDSLTNALQIICRRHGDVDMHCFTNLLKVFKVVQRWTTATNRGYVRTGEQGCAHCQVCVARCKHRLQRLGNHRLLESSHCSTLRKSFVPSHSHTPSSGIDGALAILCQNAHDLASAQMRVYIFSF